MARLNVYVPDELAARAREAGLNVSKLTQEAIEEELQRSALQVWMERVRANPPLPELSREDARQIMDKVRDEFGTLWEDAADDVGD